jgi:hypothetical protein
MKIIKWPLILLGDLIWGIGRGVVNGFYGIFGIKHPQVDDRINVTLEVGQMGRDFAAGELFPKASPGITIGSGLLAGAEMTAIIYNRKRQINDVLSRWDDTKTSIPRPVDPLVLDLNRDGKIELQNAAFFDLNANGFHEYTRSISETDAFLVLDKNADALINDGGEMFGDAMVLPDGSRALAGFDALRAYDSNEDGKLSVFCHVQKTPGQFIPLSCVCQPESCALGREKVLHQSILNIMNIYCELDGGYGTSANP